MKIVSGIEDIFVNVPMNLMKEEVSAPKMALHMCIIPSSNVDINFIFALAVCY
jgi:hypothetical protein